MDKLGQVLDDHGGLTGHFLGGGGSVERTLQNRRQHSEHRRGDDGDEGGLAESVDGLPLGLLAGVLDGVDDQRNLGSNVVVLEQSGQQVHRLETLLGNLALQVVHAGLDDGDEGLQPPAHGETQNVLVLLDLEALHALLGLVGHLADKVQGHDSALPLAGGLAEV